MEELRSTEILDREIQDDARRKAEKILKAGEAECRGIADDAAVRIASFRAQKEAEYARRITACRRDSEAAVPLEKQRKLVRFIDSSVQEELDLWFRSIGADRQLSLFAGLLERYKTVLGDQPLNISCFGYEPETIRDLAEKVFGVDRIASVTAPAAAPAPAATSANGAVHDADGLTVETADGRILCRATLAEIREELLSARREELSTALFGGRLGE